jgi:hypothetical protein
VTDLDFISQAIFSPTSSRGDVEDYISKTMQQLFEEDDVIERIDGDLVSFRILKPESEEQRVEGE